MACGACHGAEGGEDAGSPSRALLDREFLTASLWDDGKAEMAFYRAPPYGWVAVVLVKHEYNAIKLSKQELLRMHDPGLDDTGKVSSFQWSFFPLGRDLIRGFNSWVYNAAQADLRPLKLTYAQVPA